tara:strand:+ start:4342 stop:4563 length:222 start_codon:yes stop_codon:yes gene_type:complete
MLTILGAAVLVRSSQDVDFGGMFTGIILLSIGLLLGSFTIANIYLFMSGCLAVYGIYWILEKRGVFDMMFQRV